MTYFWIATESRVTELDAAVYAAWQAAGNPKAAYYTPIADPPGPGYTFDGTDWVAPPVYVPQQVTRFQALAALYGAGLLTTVESAVANSGDPLLKLAYDNALAFERQSPMVLGLASALGMTDAQLDALLTTASQIT